MVSFINFKREVCNPLKIDNKTCVSLWKNVSDCFDFTKRTGRECSVYLTSRGISKVHGTKDMVAPSLRVEDEGYPFDFHTHPSGKAKFSEADKLTFIMWKPKMACVGGVSDKGEKVMFCIQRLAEDYPFKCERELTDKIYAKQHKIEEKYKPLIEKIERELSQVIDEITKIPPPERKGEKYRRLNERRLKLLEERKKTLEEKWREIAPLRSELEKVEKICREKYPVRMFEIKN